MFLDPVTLCESELISNKNNLFNASTVKLWLHIKKSNNSILHKCFSNIFLYSVTSSLNYFVNYFCYI